MVLQNMSDPKPIRNGIIDVVDNDNGFNTRTPNDITLISSGSSNPRTDPPFTLPDGRMIDGKNTELQSFVAIVPIPLQPPPPQYGTATTTTLMKPPALAPSAPPPLVGQAVDTTGAQDDITTHKQIDKVDHRTGNIGGNIYTTDAEVVINANNNNNNNSSEGMAAIPAEALVVRSLALVDAELADSPIEPLARPSKRGTAFRLAIALAIMTASVITAAGVFCGTGNCGTLSSSTATSSTDSKSINNSENSNGSTITTISITSSPATTTTQSPRTSSLTVPPSTLSSPNPI